MHASFSHAPKSITPVRLIVVLALTSFAFAATADESKQKPPNADAADTAIRRGLTFIAKDAMAWKNEHNCVSCHHASLVIWAMREAKQSGQAVDEPFLAEMTKWLAESGEGKTGVPRPAGVPKALNAAAVWHALSLGASAAPDAVAKEGMKKFLATMEGDQIENGSWAAWPETRPPIFGNSDDSMTALATLAVVSIASPDDAVAKAVRDKGVRWLSENKCDDDPQSIAMRFALWKKLGRPAEECASLIQRIKEKQNSDGGWSQAKEMPSDAWATGEALYALTQGETKNDDPILARAREFLIRTQREDGSWAMTSRPIKPGGEGSKSLIPITCAGSAWGVIGLVRSR